jgi:hypothetical protein
VQSEFGAFEAKQAKQLGKLSSGETAAVKSWTRGGDEKMNGFLRGRSKNVDKEELSNLHKVVNRSKVPEDVVLYRGAVLKDTRGLKKGATVSDKGFMATSTDPLRAYEFATGNSSVTRELVGSAVVFQVRAKKGSKGLAVPSKVSQFGEEREVLLPPGKLKIIGRQKVGDVIVVEVQ